MTAIVDYGVGHLFSLKCSFAAIDERAEVTSDPDALRAADRIVLPGVGAFGDASEKLRSTGLGESVIEAAAAGKPLLGICLGMQLLFDRSFEYGEHPGLGLLEGVIRPISDVIPAGLKIPHMGWNRLEFIGPRHALFSRLGAENWVYFVHSYYASAPDGTGLPASAAAFADYGAPLTAVAAEANVMGCQFHPEKSGGTGLAILKAFCEM